jgi:TP901 family phage tail tape measure protein
MAQSGRRVEIDVVANDQVSAVLGRIGRGFVGLSTLINKGISGFGNVLNSYNSAMSGMNRVTTLVMAAAGREIYKFTRDAITNFSDFERQHAKTLGAIAKDYLSLTDQQRRYLDYQKQISSGSVVTTVPSASSQAGQFVVADNELRKQAYSLGTVGTTGTGALYGPTEVAAAQTALAKAGLKSQDITTVLPEVIRFAGGNDISLDQAAEYAVSMGTQWHIPYKEWGSMLDELTRTADISIADVEDIYNTMKYAGTVGYGTRQNMEDVLAAVAILNNAGLKGSRGGTGVQALITRLLTGVGMSEQVIEKTAPTERSAAALEEFKASVTDENGNMDLTNVTEQLEALMGANSDFSDEELAWFAYRIFGLFQQKAGYALANGGDLASVSSYITDTAPGTNYLKEQIMLSTQYGVGEAAANAFEGIQLDVGEAIKPVYSTIASELLKFMNSDGSYTIDYDAIREALRTGSDTLSDKYGTQAGDSLYNVGNFALNSGGAIIANLPLLGGAFTSITELLNGDVSGALESFRDGAKAADEKIAELPPEMQEFATSVKNATETLIILAGLNAGLRLLSTVLTIFQSTVGRFITWLIGKIKGNKISDTIAKKVETMTVNANIVNVYGKAVNVFGNGGMPGTGGIPTTGNPQLPGGGTPTALPPGNGTGTSAAGSRALATLGKLGILAAELAMVMSVPSSDADTGAQMVASTDKMTMMNDYYYDTYGGSAPIVDFDPQGTYNKDLETLFGADSFNKMMATAYTAYGGWVNEEGTEAGLYYGAGDTESAELDRKIWAGLMALSQFNTDTNGQFYNQILQMLEKKMSAEDIITDLSDGVADSLKVASITGTSVVGTNLYDKIYKEIFDSLTNLSDPSARGQMASQLTMGRLRSMFPGMSDDQTLSIAQSGRGDGLAPATTESGVQSTYTGTTTMDAVIQRLDNINTTLGSSPAPIITTHVYPGQVIVNVDKFGNSEYRYLPSTVDTDVDYARQASRTGTSG